MPTNPLQEINQLFDRQERVEEQSLSAKEFKSPVQRRFSAAQVANLPLQVKGPDAMRTEIRQFSDGIALATFEVLKALRSNIKAAPKLPNTASDASGHRELCGVGTDELAKPAKPDDSVKWLLSVLTSARFNFPDIFDLEKMGSEVKGEEVEICHHKRFLIMPLKVDSVA